MLKSLKITKNEISRNKFSNERKSDNHMTLLSESASNCFKSDSKSDLHVKTTGNEQLF